MTLKSLLQEEEPGTEVTVKERTKTFLKLPQTKQEIILTAALEYETMNQQEKLLKARRDKIMRPIVEGAADAYGVEDQNGHIHLVVDEETEIVRTKKVSRVMNEVSAENILKNAGIYESCIMQVVSWEIDEEKVIEAYNAGLLSACDIEKMFSEKVSWATSVKTDNREVKTIEKLRKEIEKSKIGELPEIESE